jgi:hypothetical protein
MFRCKLLASQTVNNDTKILEKVDAKDIKVVVGERQNRFNITYTKKSLIQKINEFHTGSSKPPSISNLQYFDSDL